MMDFLTWLAMMAARGLELALSFGLDNGTVG